MDYLDKNAVESDVPVGGSDPRPSPVSQLDRAFGAALNPLAAGEDRPLAGFKARRVSAAPAGFWRRFAAYILDSFILGMILAPISFASAIYQVLVAEQFVGDNSGMYLTIYIVLQVFSMVVSYAGQVLYFGYFYSRYGASLGKMVMGLKVVSLHDGTYLPFWRAGLRDLIGKVFLNTFTLGIGWLIAVFHPTKRGLHDLVFDSQVIHLKK